MRTPTIVLAIVTVLVAGSGCGGGGTRPAPAERGPAPAGPGPAPAEHGPVALTPDQYQANLDLAAGRLQQAMRGVKTARTTRGLQSRMLGAARQLNATSANLAALRPPANAIGANGDLATALDALADQASSNDEVCGGVSALTELSRTDAAANIRAASRKLAALGYRTKRLTVRRRSQSHRSLPNGSIVSRSGTGTGRLTIQNGDETDAVLKLATSGHRTILGIYVRARAVASAGGIPPGSFRVLFATGRDWDPARRGFTRKCRFTRFDKNVNYRPGIIYRLSLFSSAGGNASTSSIDESEFAGH
jgi:hypothetical protein